MLKITLFWPNCEIWVSWLDFEFFFLCETFWNYRALIEVWFDVCFWVIWIERIMNWVSENWTKNWKVAISGCSKTARNLAQAKHVSPGRDMQNLSQPILLIYSLKRVMARLGENALYQECFGRNSLACARLFKVSSTRISLNRESVAWARNRALVRDRGRTHSLFFPPNPRSQLSLTFSLSHSGRTFTHSFLCILTHNSLPSLLIPLQGKFYFSFYSISQSTFTVLYNPNPMIVPMLCLLCFVFPLWVLVWIGVENWIMWVTYGWIDSKIFTVWKCTKCVWWHVMLKLFLLFLVG